MNSISMSLNEFKLPVVQILFFSKLMYLQLSHNLICINC